MRIDLDYEFIQTAIMEGDIDAIYNRYVKSKEKHKKPNSNSIPLDAEVSDDFCIWKYDEDDDTYFTKCDNGFQVMNGSLEDNHFSYCVYCGKKVKTKKLSKNSR